MITTIFSKSRPFNYILVTSLLIIFFFFYQFLDTERTNDGILIIKKITVLLLLIVSIYITNFVTIKNGLSKDNTFVFLFFFFFLILFPGIFDNIIIAIANFCILMASRRLISLQSLVKTKEKIFDASLWIFIATLFHFWSILFIILVFASILLHVSRDYRNWILPFVAFFGVSIIFVFISLIYDKTLIANFVENIGINFEFNYFKNKFQNIALSIYVALTALFLFSQLISLSKKPLMLHSSYKKIIIAFLIGVVIFVISSNKKNEILVYTFASSAIMATSFIEGIELKWMKESTTIIITLLCLLLFFFQL